MLSALIPPSVSTGGPKHIDAFSTTSGKLTLSLNSNGTLALGEDPISHCRGALRYLINAMQFPRVIENPFPIRGNGQPVLVPGEGSDPKQMFGVYSDAAFEIPSLVSSQAIESVTELSNVGHFQGIQYADVDPVYNFLSTQYEDYLFNNNVAHTRMPNLYSEIKNGIYQKEKLKRTKALM